MSDGTWWIGGNQPQQIWASGTGQPEIQVRVKVGPGSDPVNVAAGTTLLAGHLVAGASADVQGNQIFIELVDASAPNAEAWGTYERLDLQGP